MTMNLSSLYLVGQACDNPGLQLMAGLPDVWTTQEGHIGQLKPDTELEGYMR